MGMAYVHNPLPENRCPRVLDRNKMFNAAGIIYLQEPRCTKESGHEDLHDGGWRIGQWSDGWSE